MSVRVAWGTSALALLLAGCSAKPEEQVLALIQGMGGEFRTSSTGEVISIDLSDTPATDEVLASIRLFPHVHTINCTNAGRISGHTLGHLRSLTRLETLYLVNTGLDDGGLHQARHLRTLKTLHIGHTRVTDAGMPALDHLEGLETLSLSGNPITDYGLIHLRDLRKLKTLVLRDTKTTKEGQQELRRMLPDVRIIY
jgi:Leucine-rich repeat (LRR) protein